MGDSIPKENDKSVDEELCGSLDQWLNNPVPFGVELELPPHLAAIYDKHTKIYAGELKGALNSFGQVLQTIHCKRMGQLLLDVHAASTSCPPESNDQNDIIFDIPTARNDGVGKVGEPEVGKVDEPVDGARSNGTSGADLQSEGKVDESAGRRKQANFFEDIEGLGASIEQNQDGHQPSPQKHSVTPTTSALEDDVPSCNLFPEGCKDYEWWSKIPDRPTPSNVASPGSIVTPHRSAPAFDAPPHVPRSPEIRGPVFDATPISMAAAFSGSTADATVQVGKETYVIVSSREPSPNPMEKKDRKKRGGSPMSGGPKYKKVKIDSRMEAMYQHYVMKRYKMKKMKRGEVEPPFIRIGDFHITYTNFQKSLKPRAQMCNEVMSLYIESFNIEHLSFSQKQKKFAFSVLMSS